MKETKENPKVLRDEFATAALTGLLASGKVTKPEGVAETCYKYADDLMKQREE